MHVILFYFVINFNPLSGAGDVDFHMFDLGSRSWSNSVSEKTAEMYAAEAANLSKGRRQKSNPSSPEKRVKDVARSSSVRVLSSNKVINKTNMDAKITINKKKTSTEAKAPSTNTKTTTTATGSATTVKKVSSSLYGPSNGIVRKNSKEALLSKGSNLRYKRQTANVKAVTSMFCNLAL